MTYGGSRNRLPTDCGTTLQVGTRQHPQEMCLEPQKERYPMGMPQMELREDMLEVNIPHKRYFKLDCGGLHYLKMLKIMLDLVTPAKE
jgi:hypothetical protein